MVDDNSGKNNDDSENDDHHGDDAEKQKPGAKTVRNDPKMSRKSFEHEPKKVRRNGFSIPPKIKNCFCRILKSRILKDVGFQWNPTDIPTNSNGFHRIPTDPNGFHRKKYEKVGKCWKKSEIYDPTFYDPTLAFSEVDMPA